MRHCLDKQRPLVYTETVHIALSLLGLADQEAELPQALQVDVSAARLPRRFDAHGEVAGGRRYHVGSKVDNDGTCWVEPLQ